MVSSKKRVDNRKKNKKQKEDGEKQTQRSSSLPYAFLAVVTPLAIFGVILAVGIEYVKNEVFGFLAAIGLREVSSTEAPASLPEVQVPKNFVDATKWERPDPKLSAFLHEACQSPKTFCHDELGLDGRTLRAKRNIPIRESLMQIPREFQIWDLDALRDPFVREELIRASHKLTGNHLGSGAFLAAYIAMQLKLSENDIPGYEALGRVDRLLLSFLKTLPTIRELSYHPILWDISELRELLGQPSVGFNVAHTYRNMVSSEYEALSQTSVKFASSVSRDDYTAARINVLTRAFHTGPPGPDEELEDTSLYEELRAYREILHVDLTAGGGCLALVPIADLLNHHPSNTVSGHYDANVPDNRAFTIKVHQRKLDAGSEPFISYGALTDAHLFARYGFVLADGSGLTQVSLAYHHEVLNLNISDQFNYLPYTGATEKIESYQKELLLRYLQFDDGYEHCIPGPQSHPEEAEMKRLKLFNLQRIANIRDRWILYLPPRNPSALPGDVLLQPPYYSRDQVLELFDISRFQETCRFIAMINSDYDGRAMELLRESLSQDESRAPEGNDSLEFRALMCVARWVGTSLMMFDMQFGDVPKVMEEAHRLNKLEYGSRNWTALHVRLGEMQAYHSLQNLVLERVESKWSDKKHDAPVEFTLRDDACPEASLRYLRS